MPMRFYCRTLCGPFPSYRPVFGARFCAAVADRSRRTALPTTSWPDGRTAGDGPAVPDASKPAACLHLPA